MDTNTTRNTLPYCRTKRLTEKKHTTNLELKFEFQLHTGSDTSEHKQELTWLRREEKKSARQVWLVHQPAERYALLLVMAQKKKSHCWQY